jgi:thiol-disulfide isomerase/thioredoxin
MNTKLLVGAGIMVVMILGYTFTRPSQNNAMVNDDEQVTLAETEADVTLSTDPMMGDTHMMPDGTVMDGTNTNVGAEENMTSDDTQINNEMPTKTTTQITPPKTMVTDVMVSHGSYETYSADTLARAENGKVVLFFRASWCPSCKALDTDLRLNRTSIPKDVTILDVDYDTETALKATYGVTYQHTLVQVDASGAQLAKWNGSRTLTGLVAQMK